MFCAVLIEMVLCNETPDSCTLLHFWIFELSIGAFPLHGTARFGTAYGTARLSSGQFAFPLQFSTALEWAGLFTCRYIAPPLLR